MSTPSSGGDQNQGWSPPGGAPGDPSGSQPGDPPPGGPPPGPPPDGFGQPDYSQVQPDYGQPYGQMPLALAGFWIRFGGALIDGILLAVVQAILVAIIGEGPGQILAAVLGAVYFVYFHSTTGQTLGNKLLNIKVIEQTSGDTISAGRAFIRYLVSLVSAIPLALGYLWMLWDPNKQTWHDKAASSVVVKVS